MAIFLMSLVALARLIDIGSANALEASNQAQCLRLAQSKLNEAMADPNVLSSGSGSGQFEEDTNFTWTLEVTTNVDNLDGVQNVKVTVSRPRPDGTQASVTLTQIVYDPNLRGSAKAASSSSTSGGGQ